MAQPVTDARAAVPLPEPTPSPEYLGTVVLVFGAQPQSGTSGVALAMADVAAAAGLAVQLIDSADPARTGLAGVCHTEGPAVPGGPGGFLIRKGTRRVGSGSVRVLRLAAGARPPRLDQIPRPVDWALASAPFRAQLTVVDAGFDMWTAMSPESGMGPLLWSGLDTVVVRPVLVMKGSWPSASAAEVILHRYNVGVEKIGCAPVERVVVTGAQAWPEHVRASMGRWLDAQADNAIFVPHDAGVAVDGWTSETTPPEFAAPAAAVLRTLGPPFTEALPVPEPSRRSWRRSRSS
jgi:hypothetical protein